MRPAFLPLAVMFLFAVVFLHCGSSSLAADSAGVEFFEQKVRPVLVKHCYECHSTAAKKSRGGLLLDSRDGIRKGGESGPAVVAGEPEKSLLIKAVRYDGLEMPPRTKGKLPDAVVADLIAWVKRGAPDPRDSAGSTVAESSWEEVLAQRRRWWSLQPVRKPSLPAVRNAAWSGHPVDRFLLAHLEAHGLQPAAEADPRTLIRRLSLVLTGLPPTPAEVETFRQSATRNPQSAIEELVDRLLASPQFGERWAQHWLDVVRFAETHGNEWNYEVPFAWRYRDYVVRAFNRDVPYDQFVREHLAGDLLPSSPLSSGGEGRVRGARWNRTERFNESLIGTAFYRFGDGNVEDCSAVPEVAFDVIDNQIDTLGKAFQATTIACARCHDHKLDAVSMKDYYALVGILHSSRQQTHTLDAPEVHAGQVQRLQQLKADIRKELAGIWRREASQAARYLLAAQVRLTGELDPDLIRDLDPARIERWAEAIQASPADADDLFAPWRVAGSGPTADFPAQWRRQTDRFAREQRERTAFNKEHYQSFADFRTGSFGEWQGGGVGLRRGPASSGDFALMSDGDTLLRSILPAGAFTHTLSDKLNGTLRSPLLQSAHAGKKISFEVVGKRHSDVTVFSHNCQLADANFRRLHDDQMHWVTLTVPDDPVLQRSYAELATAFDSPKFPDPIVKDKSKDKEDYGVPWDKAAANPRSFFGITRVVLHDTPKPPRPELGHLRPLFAGPIPTTPEQAARRYAEVMQAAVDAWASGKSSDDDVRWLDGLLQRGLLGNTTTLTPRLAGLAAEYRGVEKELEAPRIMPGLGDFGPGFEQRIFLRGDCHRPGEPVSRRYLEVLARPGERFAPTGSGRLELAERIASADNPLTARVMINRVWQHVFGEGLVRTVDDFGHNGERPSHPELLDYLAVQFVEDGWSVKRLVKSLVMTRAFRMSNRPSEAGRAADPEDRWLHHYPARRLEAEAIRDAILAASGRLDRTLFGPSVEPFRDRVVPHQRLFTGPVDGNGRRSLYVKHTLMETPQFLSAFNFPKGNVMQGRRDVTNVPAQALTLLNDPFVLDQAGFWAKRLVSRADESAGARLAGMFQTALNRLPEPEESARFDSAIRRLAELHGVAPEDVMKSEAVWKDLAHALFNMKEFIYIP